MCFAPRCFAAKIHTVDPSSSPYSVSWIAARSQHLGSHDRGPSCVRLLLLWSPCDTLPLAEIGEQGPYVGQHTYLDSPLLFFELDSNLAGLYWLRARVQPVLLSTLRYHANPSGFREVNKPAGQEQAYRCHQWNGNANDLPR